MALGATLRRLRFDPSHPSVIPRTLDSPDRKREPASATDEHKQRLGGMDRLQELNSAQREAVTTLSGPLLVLAGAGTGKTRVITHRTAELIRSGISPDRVLCVTFTNKAAREMQQRTAALLGRRLPRKPLVSTFHAFCVGVLRQDISALGYPTDFSIYDRGDQESAARTALRDIRVGDKALRPSDLLNRISRWKMAGISDKRAAESDDVLDDLDFLAAVGYRRYQQTLRSRGAVDFDDLLLLTNRLFAEFPKILHRHQRRFDHVQIDEYQDTNAVQFHLVESLVRPHRCLCVVGDDDQSIYGWRGADIRHILGFQSQFPGAKVVRLQDNYRSTDEILELANRLVRHNTGRHEKRLIAHKKSRNSVRILEFPDEVTEAESIVREIADLVANRAVTPRSFAILFRTNEQPRLFETEFRRNNLQYELIGGQSFFDRREIRDILAYLKVLAFPNDEPSLLRIINTPARGIGERTIEKLLARAVRDKTPLWDAVSPAAADGEIPEKIVTAVQSFQRLLDTWRERFQKGPKRMASLLKEMIDEIDYRTEIEKLYKNELQRTIRLATLEQLIESMTEYEARTRNPSVADYLEQTALNGREAASDGEDDQPNQQAVRLMTLHSAKGLEFPRVYLVGWEEGLLPHRRSLEEAESAIAEERRLAYVGLTRAQDQLTVSRAATRRKWGKPRPSIPSRFLFEMLTDEQQILMIDDI